MVAMASGRVRLMGRFAALLFILSPGLCGPMIESVYLLTRKEPGALKAVLLIMRFILNSRVYRVSLDSVKYLIEITGKFFANRDSVCANEDALSALAGSSVLDAN
jgi:hypothetical protein